jgi:hypothetical protein
MISSQDPRSVRAIEVAAGAGQWLKCRTADGRKAYGVPSQRQANVYYLVSQTSCTCVDAQRHPSLACKHCLAARLHCELVRAQQAQAAQPRRGHLRLVHSAPTAV